MYNNYLYSISASFNLFSIDTEYLLEINLEIIFQNICIILKIRYIINILFI